MKLFKKAKKGFTLVELVVVIAVIAILAAVSVGAYFGVTESANRSACEQEAKAFHTTLLLVANDPNYDNNEDYGNKIIDVKNGKVDTTYDVTTLKTVFYAVSGLEYNFVATAQESGDYVILADEATEVTFASHSKVATIDVATGKVTVA